jgi:hypothetical protein
MKIFEQERPAASRMTKAMWIEYGVKWYEKKAKGWTPLQFAREYNLNANTMSRAFRRFRAEIETEFSQVKPKSTKKSTSGNKSKDLINQFRETLRKRLSGSSVATERRKSSEWFKNRIKVAMRTRHTSRPIAGRLYTYGYDAKLKDVLPYWDKFPLVIYLGNKKTKEGKTLFVGLNLHYVPPKARQEFLEELLPHASTKNLNANTKLRVNWDMVKNLRGSDLMIKTYLPNHITTTMSEINPTDWAQAIFLPTQQFVSKGKSFGARKVWSKY